MIKYNGKDVIPRIDGKEISRVMYNGKQIYPVNNVIEIQLANVVAGDICAFDGTNKRFFRFVDSGATDDIKKYTPIGVVVIPTSHDVYGTGECGVVSLKVMDYNNPDNGSEDGNADINWGDTDPDIPNLDDKMMIPAISEDIRTIEGEQSIKNWCILSIDTVCLPSDYYNTYPNPYDESTFYYEGNTSLTYKAAPSPYLTGGLKNDIYHSTGDSGNALADMDGMANTEAILALDNSAGTNWQTAATIDNAIDIETVHPAAQCCWRYYTVGTNQGDWYLPAAGELGYLVARCDSIESSFQKIRDAGFVAISLPVGDLKSYWSSNRFSASGANFLYFDDSCMYFSPYHTLADHHYVRAFLRVGTA